MMNPLDTLALHSVEEAFPGSTLASPAPLGDAEAALSWADSPLLSVLIVACVLAAIIFLQNILNALPPVLASFARIRNCKDIEGSVRLSRDRTLMAILLMVPFVMLLSRFRLYDPSWMEGFSPEWHLAGVAGAFLAYLLLRFLLYVWLRPRRMREAEAFTMAHRFSFSSFIILTLLLLVVTAVLLVFKVNDLTVKYILFDVGVVFLALYCIRKSQIFALSCNHFTTFLYLCALEFLPTGLFVASAIVEI